MASPHHTDPEGVSPQPRRRATWFKRAVIAALVFANFGVFFVWWQIRTVEQAVLESVETIPDSELRPILMPTPSGDEPVTFLLIGSDSREGLDSLQNFGPAGGERADVIMLVQIHPDDGTAEMLSIPRDLWVAIPGHGDGKINSAFALGGASLMVETVASATGVGINHYAEVDFVGFQAIVDELGGVEIDFPFPARDTKSGLRVDAGRQTLSGPEALAFARSRSYQELQDGSWVSVDANDIGRTRRQQQLLFSIVRTVVRPSTLPELGDVVSSFASHVTIDAALAEGSLVELAWQMRAVRPDSINAATLPTRTGTVGEASVELRVDPEAEQMLAAFRDGQSLVDDDGEPLRITVLNGNGIEGSAGAWSEYLSAEGFDVESVGDADRKNFDTTTILVRPEDVRRAGQIAEALGFGTVEVGTVDMGIDALVVMGTDVRGFESLLSR